MRPSLVDPISDQEKLRKLLPLAEKVFRLHEAGVSYDEVLKQMSRLLGRVVGQLDVNAHFGTGDSEYFARRLLTDWHSVPTDLSEIEMLEVLEALCNATDSPATQDYWVRCLEVNTGDQQISDLIFWPSEYFGPDWKARDLSAKEILEIAFRKRRGTSDV